ncbi:hypothetical protein CONLIGDRAFT_415357 [Coniochaeta ligniaria NRRL 30616]|uniref:RING-type domain-containing protein n=1 Tax=Coniochaeta ligniaria NRRL 30616 TaxID=1408157 RepID=A0A1J7J1E0_9PEZI|nr:hypothetical protein CONLIGDRAFT_415357 [Coniochaeta ligniaria NRRL 30616]
MPPPPNTPVAGTRVPTPGPSGQWDARSYAEFRPVHIRSQPTSRPPTPGRQASSSRSASNSTRASTPAMPPETQHSPPPRPPRSPQPTPPLDYQDLAYVDEVDDTLICPICRTPFHEPITTKRCGHTFCTPCLRRAVDLQPICPIDRQPLAFVADQLCHPRIVSHQLDRLRVRCPNAGCGTVTTRGLIQTHYDRHCERTLVPCPDVGCARLVPREDVTSELGCLHREMRCRYCDAVVFLADRERHYDADCEGHTAKCLECNAVVVRHRMADHVMNHCPEAQTVCRFHAFGCSVAGARRFVELHEGSGCVYEAIGKLMRAQVEDRAVISDLRARLTAVERWSSKHTSRSPRPGHRPSGGEGYMSMSDLDLDDGPSSSAQSSFLNDSASNGAWESPEDYMLAQFERMEAKMEDLRKSVTELDGRHSVMLLNETMPLKDQITELRSNMGVLGFQLHNTLDEDGVRGPGSA